MITSKAGVQQVADEAEQKIVVTPSKHEKCARCWHYREDVGMDAEHPTICGRCVENLSGNSQSRQYA